jgi:hypothetical protein
VLKCGDGDLEIGKYQQQYVKSMECGDGDLEIGKYQQQYVKSKIGTSDLFQI